MIKDIEATEEMIKEVLDYYGINDEEKIFIIIKEDKDDICIKCNFTETQLRYLEKDGYYIWDNGELL